MGNERYRGLGGDGVFEWEEKRSRFIGYVSPVSTEDEARAMISRIKEKHYDARHNCSAFLLRSGVMRYSDDGEPQGTAGIPMLEVLKKSGLQDVCVVVTRYFGGILLGAGGLARAYSYTCAGALAAAPKVCYEMCTVFRVLAEYPQYERVTRMLSDAKARVTDTVYGEKVEVFGVIRSEEFHAFSAGLSDAFGGRLTPEPIGESLERTE